MQIIEELKALNCNCSFNKEIEEIYSYEITCTNELEYNRFRKEKSATAIINRDLQKWRLLVQIAEENNRIYNLYLKEVKNIKNKYANQLTDEVYNHFKNLLLEKPVIEPKIIINVKFVSPKTGNLLSKTHEINYFQIKEIMPYARWSDEWSQANNYESNLKNYILTKNFINNGITQLDELSPFEFEEWTANFMNKCGYNAFATKKSGDYGADVIAEKDDYRIAIQCKMSKMPLGIRSVQEIIGAVNFYHADEGWVLSTSPEFTQQAYKLATSTNIKLFPRKHLELLLNSMIHSYKD